MGHSGDDNKKAIDASVGGLVWVRRRNGSWWPGRILSPDELPETTLPVQRSGTPIKLLGREDASLDWYNLEKSKRVKAFRCGEYDECIEKAKATASNSSKKTGKYARRDDAIVHALELESVYIGKNQRESRTRTQGGVHGEHHGFDESESPSSFDSSEESEDFDEDSSSSEDDLDSAQELSASVVSFEEPDHVGLANEQSSPARTLNDSEDDGMIVRRMRGLEELGIGPVSSPKGKRSEVAHVQEFLKRKNRHRTLTKVLESTKMVSVPVAREQLGSPTGSSVLGVSDSKASGLESYESKYNYSITINDNGTSFNASRHANDNALNCKPKEIKISGILGCPENENAGRLFDMPPVAKGKHSSGSSAMISSASQKAQVGGGAQSSQSSLVETLSLGNEELNESGSVCSGTADIHNVGQRTGKGTFEWQLKGKRNSRSRKTDVEIKRDDVYKSGTILVSSFGNSGPSENIQVGKFPSWNRDIPRMKPGTGGQVAELAVPQRLMPYRQSRATINPKYDASDFYLGDCKFDSGLYDVTLEVNARYRPQHVPYISLMSKLTGRPIVGHPLTVDVLEGGSCDNLISGSECYNSSSELYHDPSKVTLGSQRSDVVIGKRPRGRPRTKNVAPQQLIPPTKLQKSKQRGGSTKKTRKLSSLSGSPEPEEDKPVIEKLGTPVVACVPLKVVFSRLNAALNSSI
ncbi:Tudor/PWWP/MBT superfamily protein [Forsythia ovata]|uniref:Tudor/PWWP/MBT superfamily protein n=1 Tax=Forsythia ovata TaxID=205694 RepID=A0ABD1WZ09_9LAMI